MLNFEHIVSRHGEIVVQALIEDIERREGIRNARPLPLEDRWRVLMSLEQRAA
jgi:hypothetical protein